MLNSRSAASPLRQLRKVSSGSRFFQRRKILRSNKNRPSETSGFINDGHKTGSPSLKIGTNTAPANNANEMMKITSRLSRSISSLRLKNAIASTKPAIPNQTTYMPMFLVQMNEPVLLTLGSFASKVYLPQRSTRVFLTDLCLLCLFAAMNPTSGAKPP